MRTVMMMCQQHVANGFTAGFSHCLLQITHVAMHSLPRVNQQPFFFKCASQTAPTQRLLNCNLPNSHRTYVHKRRTSYVRTYTNRRRAANLKAYLAFPVPTKYVFVPCKVMGPGLRPRIVQTRSLSFPQSARGTKLDIAQISLASTQYHQIDRRISSPLTLSFALWEVYAASRYPQMLLYCTTSNTTLITRLIRDQEVTTE